MAHYLLGQSATIFGARRSIPRRTSLKSTLEVIRTWARRQRQRQELLDYMAVDHRAAADIGLTDNDARDWAGRPFWCD